MARLWLLPSATAVLLASACLGSSTAHPPAPKATAPSLSAVPGYAEFRIRGAYLGRKRINPFFGGRFRQITFTLSCRSEKTYLELAGPVSWRERLCLAILDYRSASRSARELTCTLPQPYVNIRGRIGGRHVAERIDACLTDATPRALHDARTIVRLHPAVAEKGT